MATRQWQAVATFPNGAVTIFGIRGKTAPAALLKAYQRLAEYPVVPSEVTLHRIHWRGKRLAARRTHTAAEHAAPRIFATGLPSTLP